MSKKRLFLAAVAFTGVCIVAATTTTVGTRASETAHLNLAAAKLDHESRLMIEGTVTGHGTATVVLRVDDALSRDYGSRVNVERVFAPGPMRWETAFGGLSTPGGRSISIASLRDVMVFKAAGEAQVKIEKIHVLRSEPMPDGARGFALGALDAPLPAGFERIAPGDSRLLGGAPYAVRRPMPDPLVANGMNGIERLWLPWPPGPAVVTVWTEDPGEWELLPSPLDRRIIVNGVVALEDAFAPEDWIEQRYLRGLNEEHAEGADAWTAFGARRGRARTVPVDVGPEGIVIRLEGSSPQARFLSAVLVSRPGTDRARQRVEADRARWYAEGWPVLRRELATGDGDVKRISLSSAGIDHERPLKMRLAPGSGERLRLHVSGIPTGERARVSLELPYDIKSHAHVLQWISQQRLERRRAQDSFLTLGDNMLLAGDAAGAVPGRDGRLFEMWLSALSSMPSGRHTARLVVTAGTHRRILPVEITVIGVALPETPKPAGVYLDESPHFTWFPTLAGFRERQIRCDLELVSQLGLTGSAPALKTPLPETLDRFAADVALAAAAGLAQPVLAYAPAKRVFEALGPQRGAEYLGAVAVALERHGLQPPVWSIADEPSNPAGKDNWEKWLSAMRSAGMPRMLVAGHLNAPKDKSLVKRFDVAIINGGLGLDVGTIASAAASGANVWIYNTEAPRLAAGGWLWRTEARRYVQWHARMPTADPFDPLDGREGDEQLILPSAEGCPAALSIHRDLLDLADGVTDQRWLAWLGARQDAGSIALRRSIEARLGTEWAVASKLTRADMQSIRESIMSMASAVSGAPHETSR